MSKHLGRKDRWSQKDAKTYASKIGLVVYRQDAWYAHLVFQLREPAMEAKELPAWQPEERWLGPFKRPRNAIVELEREATYLRDRHSDDVRIEDEVGS